MQSFANISGTKFLYIYIYLMKFCDFGEVLPSTVSVHDTAHLKKAPQAFHTALEVQAWAERSQAGGL